MKRKIYSVMLSAIMVAGSLMNATTGVYAEDSLPKTANEAVADMTWGVNLADLYMAEPAAGRYDGYTLGYDEYTPKEIYDMGIAAWFWDTSFMWLCGYPMGKEDSMEISMPLPDYDATTAAKYADWAFFAIRCCDLTGGKKYKITLSDCKITAADGTILKDTSDFGANGDGILTCEGVTSMEADMNGWCWGYGSTENDWKGDIAYFAGGWNETTQRMDNGADAKYDGATFTATLTVDTAEMLPTQTKTEYYYCVNRTRSDYKTLIDTYMEQGVDIFRLPVTWTWFTQNDGDFAIDAEWLAAVKETVDYILSKGAYCILNSHDDYLQYSYVAESDGNGGYTNFHWEDQWMEEQYKEYVDARFVAIWTQIANYFKDCSDHLILEAMNEPSMKWYRGVDYNNWIIRQNTRVNGMNALFVDTVRATGGNNTTRILCLSPNDYSSADWLDRMILPEDSDYIMVQVHSYAESDKYGWSDESAMDTMFSQIAAFRNAHPKVGMIMGEVGISHSLANRADPEGTAATTTSFFKRASAQGVPCLWWEDFFAVYDGCEADSIFWLYDKRKDTWRENVLHAIKQVLYSDISGDLTGDGVVDTADLTLLQNYFSGRTAIFDSAKADFNHDHSFTRADVMYLARALAKWDGYTLN